jgi:hypothetical protein
VAQQPRSDLVGAAIAMGVDALAAELARAFAAAELDWIVLKGPSLRLALYPEGDRSYRDLDILVPAEHEQRCYEVLRTLGMRPVAGYGEPEEIALHHEWGRGQEWVDVHVTLTGAAAAPAVVWRELAARQREVEVGGARIPVLDESALALHVVLHAAQHGPRGRKWVRDLDRALARFDAGVWREALTLATALGAEAAFAAGLSLSTTRPLPIAAPVVPIPPDVALRAASAHPLAQGFDRLHRDAGRRARLRRIVRALVPTRQFMRRWSRLARRGRRGLAAAYAWRFAWVCANAPRAWIAYRRAARAARVLH